jgi:hypothetical protein
MSYRTAIDNRARILCHPRNRAGFTTHLAASLVQEAEPPSMELTAYHWAAQKRRCACRGRKCHPIHGYVQLCLCLHFHLRFHLCMFCTSVRICLSQISDMAGGQTSWSGTDRPSECRANWCRIRGTSIGCAVTNWIRHIALGGMRHNSFPNILCVMTFRSRIPKMITP